MIKNHYIHINNKLEEKLEHLKKKLNKEEEYIHDIKGAFDNISKIRLSIIKIKRDIKFNKMILKYIKDNPKSSIEKYKNEKLTAYKEKTNELLIAEKEEIRKYGVDMYIEWLYIDIDNLKNNIEYRKSRGKGGITKLKRDIEFDKEMIKYIRNNPGLTRDQYHDIAIKLNIPYSEKTRKIIAKEKKILRP